MRLNGMNTFQERKLLTGPPFPVQQANMSHPTAMAHAVR